ncbi:MAG: phosphoenolpyruvate--protein phosphotransferase, partial [Candidatus Competibacteraceae bacterium]|nr:phosphoenolpyruvate--protein phosphotransferase [Candidatus Competibacteraceae bacterium]
IVQEVGSAADLHQALNLIVRRTAASLGVDVCSVYLAEADGGQYVLRATQGLNPTAVGRVRLPPQEGLVGLVAQRREPVNLEEAADHPRFRFFPETGEEDCHSFLGVPIIHYRRVLGVLVIQHGERRPFGAQEVAFAVTLAAQLAGAIDHALALGDEQPLAERPLPSCLKGVRGAPGLALGTLVLPHPLASLESVPTRSAADPDAEAQALCRAVAAVRRELADSGQRLGELLPAEERALFEAFVMLLNEDDSLVQDSLGRIRAGQWAPGAWRDTIRDHARVFDGTEDSYLRTRGEDIRDLGRRVLVQLRARESPGEPLPEQTILVGEEISVAQIAQVPLERLAGIACLKGSALSHVAILARALGIPAVMRLGQWPVGYLEGCQAVVDGHQGRVFVEPSAALLKEYHRLKAQDVALTRQLERLRDLPAETPDGYRIPLTIKAGLTSDVGAARACGAQGVGLYRTEFIFMVRQSFPGEEEQRRLYREVLESFAPQPVTMRTLDVGGDKTLPYFPIREDNHFLGWRGMRLTLDHPEIFITQLKAMLAANRDLGNLRLLFPMLTIVEELDEALALLRRAQAELAETGIDTPLPPVGAMIEVPSAVYQAGDLARRVDFLSLGSNDLVQYLLAVDRENPRVANLYDPLHPAVLKALNQVVVAGQAQGVPVTLCGEMAGDPASALLLLGLGLDGLSCTATNLPRIKWLIRSVTQAQARRLAAEAMTLERAAQVRERVEAQLRAVGLEELLSRDRTTAP